MSKNLTRKGLALGALVALASTAIAGTPASAAGELTIAPSKGTSLNTFVTETFELQTSFASGIIPAAWTQLRYQITTDGVATILATASAATGTAAAGSLTLTNNVADIPSVNPTSTSTNMLALKVSSATATTASTAVTVRAYVDANNNGSFDSGTDTWNTSTTVNFKKYSEVTATTAITAPLEGDSTVTASVSYDAINNEQLAASKAAATFTKGDDTALTAADASITASAQSSTTATYTAANTFVAGQYVTVRGLVTNAALNVSKVVGASPTSSAFTFELASATVSSVTQAGTASASTLSDVAWSSTDKFKYVATAAATLVKGQAVKVQPRYNGTAVGTAATAAITARSISALTSDSVVSTTQAANATVALNKAFSVYAKAVDTSSPAVAIAGKTVSYSVTVAALPANAAAVTSSTATVTINGVKYTHQAALPGATGVAKLTGVTNSDGKVIVTGSSTDLANNNTIVIAFAAENFTSSITLTQTTIAPTTAYITNYEGAAAAVASGSSVSLNIAAYDQFGGAMADGYDARAVWASSTRTTTATTNTTAAVIAPVVGGKATLVLPDAGAGTGTNVWNVSLIKRSSTGGGYTGDSEQIGALNFTGGDAFTAFTVNFKAAADLVAGEITLTDGSTALALNTAKTKYVYTVGQEGAVATPADLTVDGTGTFDARGVVGTVPAPLKTVAGSVAAVAVDLVGTVKSASTSTYAGVAIPGTTVTITGAGLQFQSTQGGANVWAIGSITLNTSSSGTFSLNVWSNKSGVQTVTIKSGSATSVVDLYFDAAESTAGTAVAITAPKIARAGKTLLVSALITDKFGNGIDTNGTNTTADAGADLEVVYDGPGFVVGNLPTQTDKDGKLTFRVVLGSGDSGLATVSVKYDQTGGDLDYADATDIVKTADILIGVSATVTKAATSKATVKNAEGLTVKVVRGAKSTTKVATSDSYKVSLKGGKGTVKVYVNNILVASKK